jgi:periplasmic copper chaperone A
MAWITRGLVAVAALMAWPACAHITLKTGEAAIGAPYTAVFAVPHGCAGSATIKIRVQIPEGVIAAEPQPKPGWKVETKTEKYAASYDYHGSSISEGVKEVAWSGGKLPAHEYSEFVVSTYLTRGLKPDGMLYFPVVQECEQGVSRWIDIPSEGGAAHAHDAKSPAPSVKLIAKP